MSIDLYQNSVRKMCSALSTTSEIALHMEWIQIIEIIVFVLKKAQQSQKNQT